MTTPHESNVTVEETHFRDLLKLYFYFQSEKNTAQAPEDRNWKRLKTSHDEDENDDKPKESQESNVDNTNTPKKSDGEEKYDPLEADAESEEDEVNREVEPEANETAQNTSNGQEIKTSIDEMWTDADNDNDAEMGNLIDETDEKDHTDHEKSMQKIECNPNPPKIPAGRGGRGYVRGRGGPRARRSRR